MALSQVATPDRVDLWDADLDQYLLHNSFDPTTPPGWEKEAVKRIKQDFDNEAEWVPIFWNKWFVRALLLFASAMFALSSQK